MRIALLLLLAVACSPDPRSAEVVVRQFFGGLPEPDCALMVEEHPGDCERAVRDLNEHSVRLQEVISSQVDGRTPDAVMVRARLTYGTEGRSRVLRVERHGLSWRLRL